MSLIKQPHNISNEHQLKTNLTICACPERTGTVKLTENITLIPEIATIESGIEIKFKTEGSIIKDIADIRKEICELKELVKSLLPKEPKELTLILPETCKKEATEIISKSDKLKEIDEIGIPYGINGTWALRSFAKFAYKELEGKEGDSVFVYELLRRFFQKTGIENNLATKSPAFKYVELMKKYYMDFFKFSKISNGKIKVWAVSLVDGNSLF